MRTNLRIFLFIVCILIKTATAVSIRNSEPNKLISIYGKNIDNKQPQKNQNSSKNNFNIQEQSQEKNDLKQTAKSQIFSSFVSTNEVEQVSKKRSGRILTKAQPVIPLSSLIGNNNAGTNQSSKSQVKVNASLTTNGSKIATGSLNKTTGLASVGSDTTRRVFSSNTKNTLMNKNIVNRQFTGIGLFHQLPEKFVKNQIFKFAGKLQVPNLPPGSSPTINIVFYSVSNNMEIRCTDKIGSSREFQIDCLIDKQGNFDLGIFISGFYGFQNTITKQVLPKYSINGLEVLQFGTEKLRMQIKENRLIIGWDIAAPLTSLTFSQRSSQNSTIRRQFILSNYHKQFDAHFQQFFQFEQTSTSIEIAHADSKSNSLSGISSTFSNTAKIEFSAFRHSYSIIDSGNVNIKPLIDWRVDLGKSIRFNAVFNVSVSNTIYVILPNKKIDRILFDKTQSRQATIKAQTPLSFELVFTQRGTNILEINGADGGAIVNSPIYVDGFPLIPDYQDLVDYSLKSGASSRKSILKAYVQKTTTSQAKQEPDMNSSLSQKRQFLLYLLNALRKKYGVNPVVLDEKLNQIAQYHTDEMARTNIFGHISQNGYSPSDRAKKLFNFTDIVSENVALDFTLTEAHLGLQRSASHLQNSVNADWTRVGIGITKGTLSNYIVAYQFSSRDLLKSPITPAQLSNLKSQIAKLVSQKNPNLKYNEKLSQYISEWMNSGQPGNLLNYIMRKGQFFGAFNMEYFYVSYSDRTIDEIRDNKFVEGYNDMAQFGVGVRKKNGQSMIQSYVVFISEK